MRLQAETQVSYLFITHDIATVRAIADSIAAMYLGRVVRFGPKSGVLSPPSDDYTDLLLTSVPELRPGWLGEGLTTRRKTSAGHLLDRASRWAHGWDVPGERLERPDP